MHAQAEHPHPHLTAAARLGVRAIGLLLLIGAAAMCAMNVLMFWSYLYENHSALGWLIVATMILPAAFMVYLMLLGYRLLMRPTSEQLRALSMAAALIVFFTVQYFVQQWAWWRTWIQTHMQQSSHDHDMVIGMWLVPFFTAAMFHVICWRCLMQWTDMPDIRTTDQRIKSLHFAGKLAGVLAVFELLIATDSFDGFNGLTYGHAAFAVTVVATSIFEIVIIISGYRIKRQAHMQQMAAELEYSVENTTKP